MPRPRLTRDCLRVQGRCVRERLHERHGSERDEYTLSGISDLRRAAQTLSAHRWLDA